MDLIPSKPKTTNLQSPELTQLYNSQMKKIL